MKGGESLDNITIATINALEATNWCLDCGAPMAEGQEECPAYRTLERKREVLRHVLDMMGLELKVRHGVNVVIVDAEGHEVNL
jgi:hypothetical protein